jgi:hypothetical protein
LFVVNEVANKGTDDSAVCEGKAYIEFKNIATFPINPSAFILEEADGGRDGGLFTFDGSGFNDQFGFLRRNTVVERAVLDAGGFLVVCRTGFKEGGFDFDIPDGSTLEFYSTFSERDDNKITLVGVGSKEKSFQRLSDGSYKFAKPTPGKENVFQDGSTDGSVQGDPHFKTWRGQHYDFMGECDLIFIQSKEFESGLGLDVNIRTKVRRDMSYISSAVLRIGSDVLEVESQGLYHLNGVANAELPSKFSGFEFLHTQPTDKQQWI